MYIYYLLCGSPIAGNGFDCFIVVPIVDVALNIVPAGFDVVGLSLGICGRAARLESEAEEVMAWGLDPFWSGWSGGSRAA